jgi:hypothetical protein
MTCALRWKAGSRIMVRLRNSPVQYALCLKIVERLILSRCCSSFSSQTPSRLSG